MLRVEVTDVSSDYAVLTVLGSERDRLTAGLDRGDPGGRLPPVEVVLLAMVSVGLWGAFLGRPLIYALPVIFPAMMVAGGENTKCPVV